MACMRAVWMNKAMNGSSDGLGEPAGQRAQSRQRDSIEWALSLFLIIAITISSAYAQDTKSAASTGDRRDNISDLPAGVKPWWPSRYGADDQLGTLNEITAATVRAAANVVKQGRVIDLGRTLDENIPKFPGRYWHQSVDLSVHLTNLRRADTGGKGWGKNEINWMGVDRPLSNESTS